MRVEILDFDGCPNCEIALRDVKELLASAAVKAEIELRRVESYEQALQQRFLGSPTVRVNGLDVEPGADARRDYGIKCRLYRATAGITRVPPKAWILAALERADR